VNSAITKGGAGVSNGMKAKIDNLTNYGMIRGGDSSGFLEPFGGAGVSNSGTITNLTNSGVIGGDCALGG
jgi:hypothetical protein